MNTFSNEETKNVKMPSLPRLPHEMWNYFIGVECKAIPHGAPTPFTHVTSSLFDQYDISALLTFIHHVISVKLRAYNPHNEV